MKTALIITTYNWKEALGAVLSSVISQTCIPDEVIIADDGSREDTKQLIEQFQVSFPCRLIHSWQEDNGFQASQSRNRAIAKTRSDYIIIIDGDMVLHPRFIESHKSNAKAGVFIQGGRVLTDEKSANTIIETNNIPHLFQSGIRNRHNMIHSVILSKLLSKYKNNANSTRSCNLSFWKSDYISVNGFNEDFIGWGREDSEFVHRLLNLGLKRLYLKFSAIAYHLHHNENSRKSLPRNDAILNNTINNKVKHCDNGVSKYL